MSKMRNEPMIPCIYEEMHNVCMWCNQGGRSCHAARYEKDKLMLLGDICEKWFRPKKSGLAGEKYE